MKEIFEHRGMTEETILNHIEKLVEMGLLTLKEIEYLKKSLSKKKFEDIEKSLRIYYKKNGDWRLAPVKNALGPNVSYRDIQLVRLFVGR